MSDAVPSIDYEIVEYRYLPYSYSLYVSFFLESRSGTNGRFGPICEDVERPIMGGVMFVEECSKFKGETSFVYILYN